MKKLLAILVAVMMLLSLAACGLNGETQGGNDGGESQVENQDSGASNEELNTLR